MYVPNKRPKASATITKTVTMDRTIDPKKRSVIERKDGIGARETAKHYITSYHFAF